MHHGRALRPECSDSLEDIDHSLVLHPLEHDAQRDEDARAAHAGAAVHRDGALLAELLLGLVHLADEVDEALSGLGHALLGPVGELELADRARLAVAGVRHFELSEQVLRHVVLGQRVDHEALVAGGAVARPVLGALLLEKRKQIIINQSEKSLVGKGCPQEC